METQFNFQINPDHSRRPWEEVEPHVLYLDRLNATVVALKVARLFNAEVRMTEGNDHSKLSGSYFRHPVD